MFEAKQAAVASCMKSRGFDYIPEVYEPADKDPDHWGDVVYAQKYGYNLNFTDQPDRGPDSGPAPTTRNDLSRLPAATRVAWQQALDGAASNPGAVGKDSDLVEIKNADGSTMYFSKSACRTYGDEQVEGDARNWQTSQARVQDLAGEVTGAVDADPRIVQKKREWSSCMRQRGYQVSEPESAPESIMSKVKNRQVTEAEGRRQEIAMATADAQCVNSVGAPQVRREVMAEHEKRVLEANQNDIMAFVELQKQAVARAAALAGR